MSTAENATGLAEDEWLHVCSHVGFAFTPHSVLADLMREKLDAIIEAREAELRAEISRWRDGFDGMSARANRLARIAEGGNQ